MQDQTQYPPRRNRRRTYAIRLHVAERRLIETAAAARGEYVSEYMRRITVAAATRDLSDEAGRTA